MTITISNGVDTTTPEIVNGYALSSASRNVVHQIIGRVDPDITVFDDELPTGELKLIYASAEAAHAAHALLAAQGIFTFTDSGVPLMDMSFIRDGDMQLEQTEARNTWMLTVGYRKVTPS